MTISAQRMEQIRLIGLLYLVIIASVAFFRTSDLPSIDKNRFQAVFLSDGQVYFGKLDDHNSSFYELTQVYYLKHGNNLQEASPDSTTSQTANLNLVKLGGEVHGPEDLMYISKDKVLFIENLKNTSTVVQAIQKNGI